MREHLERRFRGILTGCRARGNALAQHVDRCVAPQERALRVVVAREANEREAILGVQERRVDDDREAARKERARERREPIVGGTRGRGV